MGDGGRFCWYELNARDPEAASAFYGAVLGWTTEKAGFAGADYRFFLHDGTRQGGLMAAEDDGPPPGWIGYVAVDDCDAAAEAARMAGGQVHIGPLDIPDTGRFAILSDPAGAMAAIIRPAPQAPASPAAPEAAWHELHTEDAEAALAFYAPLFDWAEQGRMEMGPAGDYLLFGRADEPAGIGGIAPDRPARPYWQFYFAVDRLEPAAARVTAAGGTVRHGPVQVPGGDWVALCSDAEGAAFGLHAKER